MHCFSLKHGCLKFSTWIPRKAASVWIDVIEISSTQARQAHLWLSWTSTTWPTKWRYWHIVRSRSQNKHTIRQDILQQRMSFNEVCLKLISKNIRFRMKYPATLNLQLNVILKNFFLKCCVKLNLSTTRALYVIWNTLGLNVLLAKYMIVIFWVFKLGKMSDMTAAFHRRRLWTAVKRVHHLHCFLPALRDPLLCMKTVHVVLRGTRLFRFNVFINEYMFFVLILFGGNFESFESGPFCFFSLFFSLPVPLALLILSVLLCDHWIWQSMHLLMLKGC